MLLSLVFKAFLPLCLFVWSLFQPKAGGYTYIAIYACISVPMVLADHDKPSPDPLSWSPDEIDIIRKYHLALKYPMGANLMSNLLNGFRLVGLFLLSPTMLWNQMWVACCILIGAYFLTWSIATRLDPFFFLRDAIRRGKLQFEDELGLLEHVAEKFRR